MERLGGGEDAFIADNIERSSNSTLSNLESPIMTNAILVRDGGGNSSTGTVGSESTFEKITGSKPIIMLCKFAEDHAEGVLR
jgi:hypothetical protein